MTCERRKKQYETKMNSCFGEMNCKLMTININFEIFAFVILNPRLVFLKMTIEEVTDRVPRILLELGLFRSIPVP